MPCGIPPGDRVGILSMVQPQSVNPAIRTAQQSDDNGQPGQGHPDRSNDKGGRGKADGHGQQGHQMQDAKHQGKAAGRPEIQPDHKGQTLENTRVPLVPPNPKEFDRATSIFIARATLGT